MKDTMLDIRTTNKPVVKVLDYFSEVLYFGDDHEEAERVQRENENSRAFIYLNEKWVLAEVTKRGEFVKRYQKITDDFEPRKRTAIDGRVWWYPFDNTTHEWCTLSFRGKYKLRRDCEQAIKNAKEKNE